MYQKRKILCNRQFQLWPRPGSVGRISPGAIRGRGKPATRQGPSPATSNPLSNSISLPSPVVGCANAAHGAVHGASAPTGSNSSTIVAVWFPILPTDQWNSLLNILNNKFNTDKLSGKVISKLILDSGCSHHMTGRRDLFKSIMTTALYTIGMPNGVEAVTTKQGSVALSLNFIIDNVLFILELK